MAVESGSRDLEALGNFLERDRRIGQQRLGGGKIFL
jgi:hypothetical protein